MHFNKISCLTLFLCMLLNAMDLWIQFLILNAKFLCAFVCLYDESTIVYHCFMCKSMASRSFWISWFQLNLWWSITRCLKLLDDWFVQEWQSLSFGLHPLVVHSYCILPFNNMKTCVVRINNMKRNMNDV